MNIETLKVFKDLIETGNFSKTAQLNYISQSAVSQQIKKLEMIFKDRLFERDNDKIKLTQTGSIFYECSKKIISIYQDALFKIQRKKQDIKNQELKISSVYTLGIYLVGDYIKNFLNLNPFVKINLEYKKYGEIVEEIINNKIDFGFIACGVNKKDIVSVHIIDEELVLITHPSCSLNGKNIDIKDISKFNLVLFERNTPSRKYIENIFKKGKVKLNVTMEMDNVETIKASVMSNAGVSIVPLNCVRNEEKEGRLRIFRFSKQKIIRPVFLIYNRKRRLSSIANRFLDNIFSFKKSNIGVKNGN